MAYFDAASAEPMSATAREALVAALDDGWADPVRLHREGRRANLLLDQARERMAAMVRCRADELAFTSSGTQAVQLAVLGAVRARQSASRGPGHIVVSAVEHSSVLNAAAEAELAASQLTIAGVGADGRVDVAEFTDAVKRERTVLACLQTANHEVGTIQPVAEIAAEASAAGVPLFTDAAASVGRVALPAGWSMLAASAHKWGGPPGVGVLAIRKATRWRPPLPPGSREGHRVPGFPNLPAIISATAALDDYEARRDDADVALRLLTSQIRDRLKTLIPDCVVHGDHSRTLPHIVTFSCLYIDGEALVIELDKAGFSVSSGSACASDTQQPSHVLAAMGAITHGNVRVSLPRDTTEESVTGFLSVLPGIVSRLRANAGTRSHATSQDRS
ncbi:MAG TPA: cysteine desulfurase family protein [Streptosporangiaceae bacterium]|jgi:cysteine desulfurase|nr:cysteine desulfurase family protein [Streptosporangiaceae bacterium]